MAKHPNAIKLDASFVPQWTHALTLEMEGYPALQESISAKEYVQSGQLKNYYFEASNTNPSACRKASRAVSLAAKHLRLAGNPLVWVTLSGLLREQRIAYMPREIESWNPALTVRGKGYIAIPDLYLTDLSEVASAPELHDIGNFLISHVYSGGGLILGGVDRQTDGLLGFGQEAADMIRERFELHIAKGTPCQKD